MASYSIVTGAMLMALVVTILTAPNMIRVAYDKIDLVAPPLEQPKPYEPPKPQIAKVIPPVAPPKQVIEKFEPKIIVPNVVLPKKVQAAEVAPPKPTPVKFDSPILDKMPGPRVVRAVVTNTFGSSATPTLPANTRAEKVQTGGFGDPEGVKTNANAPRSHLAVAGFGSPDLPGGPGTGNGTGGARGRQGTIASAGFGNGVATGQGSGGRAYGGGHVETTSFGDARPVAEAPSRPKLQEQAPTTPVAVTSKPTPVYTEQARKERVQGEVLLQVVFTASGQVHVLRVVRGLGYGLDESAIQAAQNVRFIPAQRNGQPVDSTATLHIVFQLS
ncbi:MAG: TonB family protein [Terriglobia bacterium]|nr:TonB family protein [Terriglobia bacterium]